MHNRTMRNMRIPSLAAPWAVAVAKSIPSHLLPDSILIPSKRQKEEYSNK
jgi:hypothetical protein